MIPFPVGGFFIIAITYLLFYLSVGVIVFWIGKLLFQPSAKKYTVQNPIKSLLLLATLVAFIYPVAMFKFIDQPKYKSEREIIEKNKIQTYLIDTQIASDIIAPAGSRIEYSGDPSNSNATVYFQKPTLIAGILFERLDWFTDDRKPCDNSINFCNDKFIKGIIPSEQKIFDWRCMPSKPVLLLRPEGKKPWRLKECLLGKQVASKSIGNNMIYELDYLMRPKLRESHDKPIQLNFSGLPLLRAEITLDGRTDNIIIAEGITAKDAYLLFKKGNKSLYIPAKSIFQYSDIPRNILLYDGETKTRSSKMLNSGYSIIVPIDSLLRLKDGQSFNSAQEVFLNIQGLYLWHKDSDAQARENNLQNLTRDAKGIR